MDEPVSQQMTQEIVDPRRYGRHNSGLSESDVANVICILYPSSPSAYQAVIDTAKESPQHVLQSDDFGTDTQQDPGEQETFILDEITRDHTTGSKSTYFHAIALRFSSDTVNPCMGFQFGRNKHVCDVILGHEGLKRVSNRHFRIFLTDDGILMLEDMSTNGTMVDTVYLKRKIGPEASRRMLQNGSIISLPIANGELMKFIVRTPARDGHVDEYERLFNEYIERVALAKKRLAVETRPGITQIPRTPSKKPVAANMNFGAMQSKSGERYNFVGQIGKGAFATVYQVATAMEGRLFAAKELDKGRFLKNGQLDQRLDNEMKIMKTLRHPNIVEYVDYKEADKYLYIFMEFVPHGDLQEFLQNKVLLEVEAKLVARQILLALDYLHEKNITHRDIKPDNILIADWSPLTVKLSDFGLSKVVKNNETFLKTFCGTLLYCAPEVFPHYDSHAMGNRTKRRAGELEPRKFHSYSQSVDIWSFGAVLWVSLCGSPPFEGVLEPAGGKGMFDKIMSTALDATPLRARGVSERCITLLSRMLDIDPSQRPNERQCLQSPWLTLDPATEGFVPTEVLPDHAESASIEEQAQAGMSQLSLVLDDRKSDSRKPDFDDMDFDSGELSYYDAHQSKRLRRSVDLGENASFSDLAQVPASRNIHTHGTTNESPLPDAGARLFGEIGQSALQSSGVLDFRTQAALDLTEAPSLSEGNVVASNEYRGAVKDSALRAGDAPSLLGAESLVRDLKFTSPQSELSPAASSIETHTPVTPASVGGDMDENSETPKTLLEACQQTTPKQTDFRRRIDLSQHPSFAPEAGQSDKGQDADHSNVAQPQPHESGSAPAFNRRIDLSDHPSFPQAQSHPTANGTPTPSSDLPPPPQRIGTLTSTPESFTRIVLRLETRVFKWGRHSENNEVYKPENDVRIPKVAFAISHWAPNMEQIVQKGNGGEWTKLDDLYTTISTEAGAGIQVNGIKLPAKSSRGHILYGRLYTGDIITVAKHSASRLGMAFECKFSFGEAANNRPKDQPFTPIETTSAISTESGNS